MGGHAHCTNKVAVRVNLTTGTGVSILVKVGRAMENNETKNRKGRMTLHSTGVCTARRVGGACRDSGGGDGGR